MASHRIIDADTHVLEPPDIWKTWLPARYLHKAPRLVNDGEGGDAWLFAGSNEPDPIGLVATPGKPFDEFRWTGVTYDEARPGCYDGVARLGDMDLDGIDMALVFAPQRTISHFLGDDDDDFVRAGVEAYNRFLTEQFCAADPARLIGLPQIPSTGIDDAVDVLAKEVGGGARSVVISNWPSGGDSLSDDDDPFWAAAAEAGVPVAIHINVISRRARQAGRVAAASATDASPGNGATSNAAASSAAASSAAGRGPMPGGRQDRRDLYGGDAGRASAKAVGGLAGVFSMVPGTISQLIFTGVFERFPDLQIMMVETGVGWIAHFLEQMDDRYWRNRSWGNLPIAEPPSFYWHRNLSATFITDQIGIATRHAVGVENMMWSSDYPHHGNDWPYSRRTIQLTMGHIPRTEKDLITAGNAARILHL